MPSDQRNAIDATMLSRRARRDVRPSIAVKGHQAHLPRHAVEELLDVVKVIRRRPVLRRRRPDDRGRMTPALLSPHTAALASNGSLLGLLSEFVEANAATVHLIAGEQRTELESMAPAPSSVPCHARARDGRPSRPAHASIATRARRSGGAQRGSHLGLYSRPPRPARSRSCGSRGPWLRRPE